MAIKLFNKLRREISNFFKNDRTKEKLKKRKGKCKKCGKCCSDCKYLDRKTKLCKVYENRPKFCYREFPLDEKDQNVFGVKDCCGYWFENN